MTPLRAIFVFLFLCQPLLAQQAMLRNPQEAVFATLQDSANVYQPHLYFWVWVDTEDDQQRKIDGAVASINVNLAMSTDNIILPTPLYGGRLLRWNFWELAHGDTKRFEYLVKTWHDSFRDNWIFQERFELDEGGIVFVPGQHVQNFLPALCHRTGSWRTDKIVAFTVPTPEGPVIVKVVSDHSPLVRWDHLSMVLTSQEVDLGGRYYDFRFGSERDGRKILKSHGFDITNNRERAYVASSKPALRKGRIVEVNRDQGGGLSGDWMATWDISIANVRDPNFSPGLNLLEPRLSGTEILFPLGHGLLAGFAGDANFKLVNTVPDGIALDYQCGFRLDGGIQSCYICHGLESKSIICHFGNSVRDYQRGGLDLLFDKSALTKLKLNQEQAVQELARQYGADLSDGSQLSLRMEFVHKAHERAIRLASGGMLDTENYAKQMQAVRKRYRFDDWDAARMLDELYVDYEGDAVDALKRALPPTPSTQELRLGALRGKGTIHPEMGRAIYRDCATRLIAQQLNTQ